jgi:O-antigen ligase
MGTTGNPQHCAVVLGLCITPLCYLVSQPYQTFKKRIFFGGVAALAGIFLLWTGSRTGVLMGFVGLVVMYRYRMGRALLLASFAAIFVMIFLAVFSNVDIFSQHLISGEDTRTGIWRTQWDQFLSHPILGANFGLFGYSENSYLATAARYGIVGLIPLFIMLGIAGRSIVRLHRSRKFMGDFTLAADMVIGSLISLAVGAWFEAYLLGTLTFMVYLIYIDFALMNALIDLAEAPIPDVQTLGAEVSQQNHPQFAETF